MTFRGSFQVTGFTNEQKYLWQFNKQTDDKGTMIYHVLRPLFKTQCGRRYWEFTTREKHPNMNINLANGDSLCVDTVGKKNKQLHVTVTWTQKNNRIWSSIKDTSMGKLIETIDNGNISPSTFKNMDDELDNAVVFCQKLANGIQLLQDKLAENGTDIREIFPSIEPKSPEHKK